jgi:hypothetical protein
MDIVKGTIRIKGKMFHTGDELPEGSLSKERRDQFIEAGILTPKVKTEKPAAPKAGKAGKAEKDSEAPKE